MKNKKAEKVIKRLQEENKTYHIQILGDEKNKEYAFSILMNFGEGFNAFKKDNYSPISKKVIALLDEAEIKYKVLE